MGQELLHFEETKGKKKQRSLIRVFCFALSSIPPPRLWHSTSWILLPSLFYCFQCCSMRTCCGALFTVLSFFFSSTCCCLSNVAFTALGWVCLKWSELSLKTHEACASVDEFHHELRGDIVALSFSFCQQLQKQKM